MTVHRYLPDGSFLSIVDGRICRVIDAEVSVTVEATVRTSRYRLVTSLIDDREAPAKQLVELYHRQWEIETCYVEIKSTLGGGQVFRGRYPQAVEQEVWAIPALYQGVRVAMADSVLHTDKVAVDRLSFSIAVNTARDLVVLGVSTTGADGLEGLVGRIGTQLLANIMPVKRVRTRIRVVKRALSRHPTKGKHIDRTTYQATISTKVLATHLSP